MVAQTGLMNDEVKVPLLGLWMALFVIFAGRKFSQPIKVDLFNSLNLWNSLSIFVLFHIRNMTFSDSLLLAFQDDIGDKSVFMFNTLPEDQKNALVEKLRAEKVESEP